MGLCPQGAQQGGDGLFNPFCTLAAGQSGTAETCPRSERPVHARSLRPMMASSFQSPMADRHPVGDLSTVIMASVTFLALLPTAQMGLQVTSFGFVLQNIRVDPITAGLFFLFRKPQADLLRTPVLTDQRLNLRPALKEIRGREWFR